MEAIVKDGVEIVRILEAFDLMGSFRGAGARTRPENYTGRHEQSPTG